MRRTFISGLLLTALSVLGAAGVAQNSQSEKRPKSIDSLPSVLKQLNEVFKEGSVFEKNQWSGLKRSYVSVKQKDGCNVEFRQSEIPPTPLAGSGSETARAVSPNDLSATAWRLNLSDLAADELKIQASPIGDYRMLQIATSGNKNLIESKTFSAGQSGWVSSARFKIDAKQLAAAVAELSKAIRICTGALRPL